LPDEHLTESTGKVGKAIQPLVHAIGCVGRMQLMQVSKDCSGKRSSPSEDEAIGL
jgi:hypothetical protein